METRLSNPNISDDECHLIEVTSEAIMSNDMFTKSLLIMVSYIGEYVQLYIINIWFVQHYLTCHGMKMWPTTQFSLFHIIAKNTHRVYSLKAFPVIYFATLRTDATDFNFLYCTKSDWPSVVHSVKTILLTISRLTWIATRHMIKCSEN